LSSFLDGGAEAFRQGDACGFPGSYPSGSPVGARGAAG